MQASSKMSKHKPLTSDEFDQLEEAVVNQIYRYANKLPCDRWSRPSSSNLRGEYYNYVLYCAVFYRGYDPSKYYANEISEEFGINPAKIRKWLKRKGLTSRPVEGSQGLSPPSLQF